MLKRRSEGPPRPAVAEPSPEGADTNVTAHEAVYRALRERILFGGFLPGGSVTLRGLAEGLGVSPMPVRDAVRRLTAERALVMLDNRRVLVAPMTREKFDQILYARSALEGELAARALANIKKADIEEIVRIDDRVDQAMADGDVPGYMRANYEFHFSIYERARADVLVGLVESIWMQFGPFMRMAYGRFGTSKLEDHHEAAILAMRRADASALRAAISADIGQGMAFIGEGILSADAGDEEATSTAAHERSNHMK